VTAPGLRVDSAAIVFAYGHRVVSAGSTPTPLDE
jgi:hypothetical protein